MTNPVNKKVDRAQLAVIIAAEPKRSNASIGRHFGVTGECIRCHRVRMEHETKFQRHQAERAVRGQGPRYHPEV